MQRVIVTIDKDGTPTVTVNGVKGSSCEALTADLERALGSTTTHERTSEYLEVSQSVARKETA